MFFTSPNIAGFELAIGPKILLPVLDVSVMFPPVHGTDIFGLRSAALFYAMLLVLIAFPKSFTTHLFALLCVVGSWGRSVLLF